MDGERGNDHERRCLYSARYRSNVGHRDDYRDIDGRCDQIRRRDGHDNSGGLRGYFVPADIRCGGGFLDLLSDRHKHDEHRCDVVGVGRNHQFRRSIVHGGSCSGDADHGEGDERGGYWRIWIRDSYSNGPHHYIRDRLVLAGHLAGSHDRNQPMHSHSDGNRKL